MEHVLEARGLVVDAVDHLESSKFEIFNLRFFKKENQGSGSLF